MNKYQINWKKLNRTAAIISAAVLLWILYVIYVPTAVLSGAPQRIHIPSGQSLSQIANSLADKKYIHSPLLFMLYVSAQGWEEHLKAGEYIFPENSALNDIASQIASGRGESNDVTVFIPEGFNIWEIDKRFAESGLIKEGQLAASYQSREGYLFPDTYRFNPKSLLGEIVQKMESNGETKTRELLGDLTPGTRELVVILASIIEKEAKSEIDMHLVSGVIVNRIRRGMPLQIDATVSYGACLRQFRANPAKNCEVHLVPVGREVRIDSAYNTYTRPTVPPGPISNPGLQAIKAALEPKGDYLYYLSTRDGSQILFSHTAAEHAAKRKQYLGL